MSAADRAKWDARYATGNVAAEPEIDDWLASQLSKWPPGRALEVACGTGHLAVWLAERGWRVTAVDVSPVGLAQAAELARIRRVSVNWIAADLDDYLPPPDTFDLVTVSRFLDRGTLPSRLTTALAPGGRLVYQTFCDDPAGGSGHRNPAFVLRRGELPTLLADLTPQIYEEIREGADFYARFCAVKTVPEVR